VQNLKSRKTKVSLNKATGLLEVIDEETGKLVAIQSTPDEDLLADRREKLVERLLPNGEVVLVQADIDPSRLRAFDFMEYSSYVVDLICEKIVEGESLKTICMSPGFPTYATLCRWKKQVEGIQEQLDQARRDRAEMMRDEAWQIAKDAKEHNVDSSKLKVQTAQWLASTDNKERFGSAKAQVELNQPLQIIVNTGIVREAQHANPTSIQSSAPSAGNIPTLPSLSTAKD
jgi:hypothetical protein